MPWAASHAVASEASSAVQAHEFRAVTPVSMVGSFAFVFALFCFLNNLTNPQTAWSLRLHLPITSHELRYHTLQLYFHTWREEH